jgi:hypothetical protein
MVHRLSKPGRFHPDRRRFRLSHPKPSIGFICRLITVERMVGRFEPLAQHDPMKRNAGRLGMLPNFQTRPQSRERHEIRVVAFDGNSSPAGSER